MQVPPCENMAAWEKERNKQKTKRTQKSKFNTNSADLVISCPKDLSSKLIQHFTEVKNLRNCSG